MVLAANSADGALSLPVVLTDDAGNPSFCAKLEARLRAGVGTDASAAEDPARARFELLVTLMFEEFGRSVFRYIRAFVRDVPVARDLTQEVFVRLCSELSAGRPVTEPRAWLFRVAHNVAIDEQRRQRSREVYEQSSDGSDFEFLLSDPAPSAEHELLRRERHGWLRAAVQGLSAQERRCLFLRAQGLRYREIAEVLEIRIPTVVTFLTRAIQKLTKARP